MRVDQLPNTNAENIVIPFFTFIASGTIAKEKDIHKAHNSIEQRGYNEGERPSAFNRGLVSVR